MINTMSACLATDCYVRGTDFGSFSVRPKNDRVGRSPMTNVEVTVDRICFQIARANYAGYR
jgi:nucleoid DNA-binding protein